MSLPVADFAFAETTHVLHRVGIAGAFGLGAGPLFLGSRKRRAPTAQPSTSAPSLRMPTWRMSLLGSAAAASAALPFLCAERLCFRAMTTGVDLRLRDRMRYALYASHALGTVLGAAALHVARRTRGRVHVPVQVFVPMLCKAHLEASLLRNGE